MSGVMAIYNRLPRWVTVIWWVAVSAAASAALNDVTTGVITINPTYALILNPILVAIKDFANANSENKPVAGGNP